MRAIRAVIIVAATVLVLNAGCSSNVVRVGPRPAPDATLGQNVEASGCGLLFLDLFPIGVNSRTERAYKNAVGTGSGLADTQIRNYWFYFPFLGNVLCTTIKGTVVR